MNRFHKATIGWYRAVLAPNTVLAVISFALIVAAVVLLLLHYTITAAAAVPLADFSAAITPLLGTVSLLSGVYGLSRGYGAHPALDRRYHEWLRSTPWAPGEALPKGPITPTWQDGLFLGAMTAIASAYADQTPHPTVAILGPLTLMATGFALAWTMANLVTRNVLAVYGALLVAPTVANLLLGVEPSALTAGVVAAAAVAYWGILHGLRTYPWEIPPKDKRYVVRLFNPDEERQRGWQQHASFGWPYMQLLESPREFRVPILRATLEAAIAAEWIAFLGRLFESGVAEFPWAIVFYLCFGLVVAKLTWNLALACPSLCLGERVVHRRPIVWRHDRLIAEPLVIALAMFGFGVAWFRIAPGPHWLGAALTAAIGVWMVRRLGAPFEHAFYTGPQSIRGVMMQRPHFERLAAPGD